MGRSSSRRASADGAYRDSCRDRGLPDALVPAWGAVNAAQRKRTAELLQAWQTYPGMA